MSTKQLGRVIITYPGGNTTAIVLGDLSGYPLEKVNAQLMS
ncbi:MAG: hypothetical protein ACOCXP_03075 [Candidatus Dojkabacteria bacterium]